MKSLLFLSLTIMSLSAFACPNLEGNYKCENYDLSITQQDIGNNISKIAVVTNGYLGETYFSDGKKHQVEDTTRQTTCTDESMKVVFRLGIISTSETYSINKDGNLEIFTRNVIIPSKETCIKI